MKESERNLFARGGHAQLLSHNGSIGQSTRMARFASKLPVRRPRMGSLRLGVLLTRRAAA